ncbi:hypothetical protein C8R48DRAFT_751656 [Suillus tomentosus]|nr:hypothetical protein C8R48DRAFT_751656 [Suillus tomentosus]
MGHCLGMKILIMSYSSEFSHFCGRFVRSRRYGFGAFRNAGSGPDSPTIMTPIALPERSESAASENSFSSQHVRQTGKSLLTTQPSITASSPIFKKPSLHPSEAHSRDHQTYPVLKNPLNRSTSSSPHSTLTSNKTFNATPPTPGSSESRPPYHHSQSGSIFHDSDTGSDHGHGFSYSSSPSPVSRVPDAFGTQTFSSDGPSIMEEDDDVSSGPKMSSDYALRAVFIRFTTLAEAKMNVFLRETLDDEPVLSNFMGPSLDPKVDDLMGSLGKIAQKRGAGDAVMMKIQSSLLIRGQEPSILLNERKLLASIYITCRALIAVLSEIMFERFKRPNLKLLAQSANHRLNAELHAALPGHLANVRFVSVTDRFLGEPAAYGQYGLQRHLRKRPSFWSY